jgi:hypothetical protein
MKKLILDLEALKVDTFEPAEARSESRGTVMGAEAAFTGPANCVTISCGNSEVQPCFQI